MGDFFFFFVCSQIQRHWIVVIKKKGMTDSDCDIKTEMGHLRKLCGCFFLALFRNYGSHPNFLLRTLEANPIKFSPNEDVFFWVACEDNTVVTWEHSNRNVTGSNPRIFGYNQKASTFIFINIAPSCAPKARHIKRLLTGRRGYLLRPHRKVYRFAKLTGHDFGRHSSLKK